VIDELHAYRGVFGSHLANVLRRLHRICRHYGATPQFVMASATIANPGELARRLVGEPVEAIAESGAPTGDKTFVCYNPPVVNHELGIRAPYLGEAAKLAIRFLRERIATTVFVATSAPLDQFIVTHPVYDFGSPPEHARVHPDNPFILVNHLKSAAFELRIGPGAAGEGVETFGDADVRRLLAALEDEGVL